MNKTKEAIEVEIANLEIKAQNLENKLSITRRQIDRLVIADIKPIFEKEYINTYWKFKDDYGEKKHSWFAYIHVKKIKSIWSINGGIACRVLGDVFELTSDKKLIIKFDEEMSHSIFTIKITKKAFTNAVSKIFNKAKEAIK